jgi:hypothetical protein
MKIHLLIVSMNSIHNYYPGVISYITHHLNSIHLNILIQPTFFYYLFNFSNLIFFPQSRQTHYIPAFVELHHGMFLHYFELLYNSPNLVDYFQFVRIVFCWIVIILSCYGSIMLLSLVLLLSILFYYSFTLCYPQYPLLSSLKSTLFNLSNFLPLPSLQFLYPGL